MPSMRFSFTSSAIRSSRRALFTMNGISVTMIASRSLLKVSMLALARIMKRPRPVRYASKIPARP